MPTTTTMQTNLPLRSPPSSIADAVQRSPVLSSKVAEPPRQQRSGSVRPLLPPQPLSAPPQSPVEEKNENGPEESKIIDMEIFQQILELDEDDEECSFSQEMVKDYRDQAAATFVQMKAAIDAEDCTELSSLGHFLKGSSAALGVIGVRESCELIQNYGNLRDEKTGEDLTPEDALSRISDVLGKAKEDFKEAEAWLEDWYGRDGEDK